MKRLSQTLLWLLVVPIIAACTTRHQRTPPDTQAQRSSVERVTLNVALFPWIPDAAEDGFTALKQRLEAKFEAQHPDIDVVLRLIPDDDSYYKPAKISGWLAGGQYDVVEIDTVILGDLVDADVLAPWPDQSDTAFFNAAQQGATLTGAQGEITWWGVPHYQCGYFVISRSNAFSALGSLAELHAAVEASGLPLLGNFDSSWDLPSLYLDAVMDHGVQSAQLDQAVRPPLHHSAAQALVQLSELCQAQGVNPCVDGTFDRDGEAPVQRLVAGEASGLWGYSERLHPILKQLYQAGSATDSVHVTALPLGHDVKPLLFTDAFVRSVACAGDDQCQQASQAFVAFMNSPWAINEIFLSGDVVSEGMPKIPRYLLPAARSAFTIEAIKNDRFYQALKPYLESGEAMPNNAGIYERRRVLAWLLSQALQ